MADELTDRMDRMRIRILDSLDEIGAKCGDSCRRRAGRLANHLETCCNHISIGRICANDAEWNRLAESVDQTETQILDSLETLKSEVAAVEEAAQACKAIAGLTKSFMV